MSKCANKQSRESHNAWAVIVTRILLLSLFTAFGPAAAMADIYAFRGDGGVVYYTNVPGEGRFKVRLPLKGEKEKARAKKEQKTVQAVSAPQKLTYESAIATAGELFAIDPDLIRAVIKAESNFNPLAVSHKGAAGLMQLMPGTAEELGVADPFDPVENIHGGTKYLSQLLDALNGSLPLALAAYNAGPLRVIGTNRIPPIPETRDYVARVLRYYEKFYNDEF
jgi:Soluble lytic murein transglycosylase and related regulatory proteins (some contain LysM/invasin domains)